MNTTNDPYQSEEYAKFVESMVQHCHCKESNRPCDGVLSGGLCDDVQESSATEDDDEWRREREDYEFS